jgi:hypothetical protein
VKWAKPILQVAVKQFGKKEKSEARRNWLRTVPIFALIGGCRETGISRQGTRSHTRRSHTSHRFYPINFFRDYYNHTAVDQDR